MSIEMKREEKLFSEGLRQTTNTVVMVSPDQFGFNPQTAGDNSFQVNLSGSERDLQKKAMEEWLGVVDLLRSKGVNVIQLPTQPGENKPDAVFPNNWFTHHQGGTLVLYPMRAHNRSLERQPDVLKGRLRANHIPVLHTLDLTGFEKRGLALEGTGSLVLDRVNHQAFAVESPRADREPFEYFCQHTASEPHMFHAFGPDGKPIYHTNVIMSIGTSFVAFVHDSVPKADDAQLGMLCQLQELGKQIIPISMDQMTKYGANVLELEGAHGPIIIASETAVKSYDKDQLDAFGKHGELVAFHMPVIETIGGGSARCILAEVFPGKISEERPRGEIHDN